jgi:hypothetical protein
MTSDRSGLFDVLVFVPGVFYTVLFAKEYFGAPAASAVLAYCVPAIAFLLLAFAHRAQARRIDALLERRSDRGAA